MFSIQDYLVSITFFINDALLPVLFALALLFFVFNSFRFFILGHNESDAKEKAKQLAIYGIAAFVLLVSIWGIVNLIVYGLDISGDYPVTPDYFGSYY